MSSTPYEVSPTLWKMNYLGPKEFVTFKVDARVVKCVDVSNYVFSGDRVNNVVSLYETDSAHVQVSPVYPSLSWSMIPMKLSRLMTTSDAFNFTMDVINAGASPAVNLSVVRATAWPSFHAIPLTLVDHLLACGIASFPE